MPDDYIQRLKDVSVVQILQDIYNIMPQKRGDRYYCKIRSERTGSCCIYPTNTWYDFGSGVGGDSISLVQNMELCDKKDAMQKLADYYGISPDNRQRSEKELWDNEWKFLGIYPDMVSKNLNIAIIDDGERAVQNADINLNLENAEQIKQFEEKYHISMNEFRKIDAVGYHNILKKRILIPLFTERDDYFSALLSNYMLSKEIGGNEFAKSAVSNDNDFIQISNDLNKKSILLRRAVDDISLLKVPLFSLAPKQDLNDILSGKVIVKLSKVGYYNLCLLAQKHKCKLSVATVSYDDYREKYAPNNSALHRIPHSTAYKNGICTIHFFQNYTSQINEIFSGCEMKIKQIPDNFHLEAKKKEQINI